MGIFKAPPKPPCSPKEDKCFIGLLLEMRQALIRSLQKEYEEYKEKHGKHIHPTA